MKKTLKILVLLATVSVCAYAQGTAADYERAARLKAKYEAAVVDVAGPATWKGNTHRVWYRKQARGTNRVHDVGLYGGSAGGQNALGGLLFHPEFYKAAVAYAGCHDNRME